MMLQTSPQKAKILLVSHPNALQPKHTVQLINHLMAVPPTEIYEQVCGGGKGVYSGEKVPHLRQRQTDEQRDIYCSKLFVPATSSGAIHWGLKTTN